MMKRKAMLALAVSLLGLFGGFISGLLGIGGGIIMAPLLLYVPGLLGLSPLGMHAVAGLTITQGLAGCLSGVFVHHRHRFVNRSLVIVMGIPIAVAAWLGGLLSEDVAETLLLGLFGILALIAAVMMFVPRKETQECPDATKRHFNRLLAVCIAATVGFLGGLVGQGGSFILIPLMLYALRIPTRIAVGSNLGIVLFSSLAGFLGKWMTGQIPLGLALALVVGVLPGAQLGGLLSKHLSTRWLRTMLAALITAAVVKIGAQLFR